MNVLVAYVKQHRKGLIFFLFSALLIIILAYLYHTPWELPAYWFLSFAFFGGLVLFVDFIHYRRKHQILQGMSGIILSDSSNMPLPENLLEEDYSKLVEILDGELRHLKTEVASGQQDMVDYYAMWVHQIKTPIAAMGLILDDEENCDLRELKTQLFKVEQYADMVLQYIRLESPSTDYCFEKMDLDQALRQSVRKYAPLFIRKKLALHYEGVNCQILSDKKWIVFVLDQILSNALKYTRKGSISIYMSEEKEKTLVIEDTGMGISSEDLPRICEKNYTGFNGRKDKKATGLGLYLCKTILDRLGHGLTIESQPGTGTQVKIDFSAVKVEYE